LMRFAARSSRIADGAIHTFRSPCLKLLHYLLQN
jgi:hypothetical protein